MNLFLIYKYNSKILKDPNKLENQTTQLHLPAARDYWEHFWGKHLVQLENQIFTLMQIQLATKLYITSTIVLHFQFSWKLNNNLNQGNCILRYISKGTKK